MMLSHANSKALLVIVALAMAPASSFAGQCRDYLQDHNQSRTSHQNFLQAVRNGVQKDLHELRRAAMILEMMGNESACMKVVEAARTLLTEGRRRHAEPSVEALQASLAPAPSAIAIPNRPKPKGQVLIGSNLLDRKVHSRGGTPLGEIRDILVSSDNGCSSAVLVGHGGVLGFGEKLVLIPTESLYEDDSGRIVIHGLTPSGIQSMPAYKPGDWPLLRLENWQAGICGVRERTANLNLPNDAHDAPRYATGVARSLN